MIQFHEEHSIYCVVRLISNTSVNTCNFSALTNPETHGVGRALEMLHLHSKATFSNFMTKDYGYT